MMMALVWMLHDAWSWSLVSSIQSATGLILKDVSEIILRSPPETERATAEHFKVFINVHVFKSELEATSAEIYFKVTLWV